EIERFEGKSRGVAAWVAVPAACLLAALHHASAHNNVIAALERDLLLFRGIVKIIVSDPVAVVERFNAFVTRHIEKHAATHHPILGFLMPHFSAPDDVTSRQS